MLDFFFDGQRAWQVDFFGVGAQIGGQAVDLVLVIQNRRGLEQLVSNQFKVGADASVAGGPARVARWCSMVPTPTPV